jgi:D-glycero-alpha-D-manno-heptose 1-phosphate guanylyltransferase
MISEAIVLAGGFGTRLQSVVQDVPKPMADINGKPFLYYLLKYLSEQGIKKVVLSVGYKHELIKDFFGEHYLQMDIKYAIEDEPLGTGGAIKLALDHIDKDLCFVLNGDTYFDLNLIDLERNGTDCVLASKEMNNFDRYGSLELTASDVITNFNEKKFCESGWINGGVYCIHKNLFSSISKTSFSFEEEVLTPLSRTGQLIAVKSKGYFMDIGIPEDYAQFQKDIYKPITELNIDKSWTLFLDRDGVINDRLIDDYVKQLNELSILEGVPEAITAFNAIFKRIVVVTNQQGIGKGMMDENDLEIIHGYMNNIFEDNGGKVEKFYFAPQLVKEGSNYRKPGTGMGLHAQKDFPDIEFNKCLMIGDSESDIEFGMKLGMKTIMLTTIGNVSTKADYIFDNLQTVAKQLTNNT